MVYPTQKEKVEENGSKIDVLWKASSKKAISFG